MRWLANRTTIIFERGIGAGKSDWGYNRSECKEETAVGGSQNVQEFHLR